MHTNAARLLRLRHGWGLWTISPQVAVPTAIGLLALLLRLYGLGDKPFWLDEVTSLHRATTSVPELVADALHNNHYPSYFLLLWLIAKIGTSQWLLRLPSALFGAAAAVLTCAIGRRVADLRTGAVAGLLMALSPFEVQFGQEARSYTLVSCLILTALWGLVRLAQEPAFSAFPLNRHGALRGPWLAYCTGTAAALSVLNVAVPWLLASNIGALMIARRPGSDRRPFLRNWGLAQAVILALWLPSVAAVYFVSSGTLLDGAGWAPAETSRTIWSIIAPVYLLRISSFITYDVLPATVPGLPVVSVALALFGAWRLRRNPTMLVVIGCSALLLPLGLLLLSPFVPVLVPRYFAWSAAPFFILAGVGLSKLSKARFTAMTATLAAVCLINLMPYYDYETKPRWDLLASRLAATTQPGDVVLFDCYYSYLMLSVFASHAGLDEHKVSLTWQPPDAAKLAPGHDLWVVYGRSGQAKKKHSPDQFLRDIASLGHPAVENSVGRYIVLWRFAAPQIADQTPPLPGLIETASEERRP